MQSLLFLIPFLIILSSLFLSVVYCATVLSLQRAFPLNQSLELHQLKARDRLRHARLLQGFVGGVVDFSVQGSSDPYNGGVNGYVPPLLYFTRVKLGTPPREFSVQIDTGSDVLWVTCSSCSNCPQSSGLGIPLDFYDSTSSSTAGLVPCSHPICTSQIQTAATQCPPQSNQCSYAFQYGDGSATSGYYVSDTFYFDAVMGQSEVANSSSAIIFGCSTYQSGDLTKPDKAVDGIFGFGQGDLSVISQLSSRRITPRIFSHCLKGAGTGGGILVLGEIMEPGLVYTPLVPSQPHYNLNLLSISVIGQVLPIDPAVFATSSNRGTIIDTGTTLAYLIEEAYDPFVNAITTAVSQSATPTIYKGNQCYYVSNSVSEVFPAVSFNFAGGATMSLKPEEYLMYMSGYVGATLWCIGFQKVQGGITILGDIVLKDKIFVYDLAHQRIGWANYDCSSSVNVSARSSKDFVNAGQLSVSSLSRDTLLRLQLPLISMSHLIHMFLALVNFQLL